MGSGGEVSKSSKKKKKGEEKKDLYKNIDVVKGGSEKRCLSRNRRGRKPNREEKSRAGEP